MSTAVSPSPVETPLTDVMRELWKAGAVTPDLVLIFCERLERQLSKARADKKGGRP